MPHLTIEYSKNLTAALDVQALVDRLHAATLDTGLFEIGALRTRAAARRHYRIADGHPDNGFVHIVLRMRQGREAAAKRRAGELIFAAACDALAPIFDAVPLGISFEIQEIDPELSFKRNTLHEIVRQRRSSTGEPAS